MLVTVINVTKHANFFDNPFFISISDIIPTPAVAAKKVNALVTIDLEDVLSAIVIAFTLSFVKANSSWNLDVNKIA